jgi:exonuclease VII large subunit
VNPDEPLPAALSGAAPALSPPNTVPLREFLEEQRKWLERLLLREIDANERAKTLQASEYERRLRELNHAHEQARQKEADYLDRATFNIFDRTLAERLEKIESRLAETADRDRLEATAKGIASSQDESNKRISELERARSNLDGRITMLGIMLFALQTVMTLAFAVVDHFLK